MEALDIIFYVAILAAILTAPVILFSISYVISDTTKGRRVTGLALIIFIVFIVSVAVGLAAGETSADIGYREVLTKLESVEFSSRVLINGKKVENADQVLAALKTLDWLPDHHSSPTKRINIEIANHAPRLTLSLARDSSDPREYWVYYPRFYCVFGQTRCLKAEHDIGRVKTSLFDAE
jgi:hypothetical protein